MTLQHTQEIIVNNQPASYVAGSVDFTIVPNGSNFIVSGSGFNDNYFAYVILTKRNAN